MLLAAEFGPQLERLLSRFGLRLRWTAADLDIPGSYWGNPEAGLVSSRLMARSDTPLHSVLHEASHFICMTPRRRQALDTDAGGDDAEEDAVCWFQLSLAAVLDPALQPQLMADMDEWGYSFRLGSTARWHARDAEDARLWLENHRLIDESGRPRYVLRGDY